MGRMGYGDLGGVQEGVCARCGSGYSISLINPCSAAHDHINMKKKTFHTTSLCEENAPVPGEFPHKAIVVFMAACLNNLYNKHSNYNWFETA